MTSLTRRETAQWLHQHDNFLILTHRRPDGDTIGSAAVLCRGLRQLGKTAHVLERFLDATRTVSPSASSPSTEWNTPFR